MSIYTKTGDDGTTALFGGKRVLKSDHLVDVYGGIDELNSWIGVIVAHLKITDVRLFFTEIQKDLLLIGSIFAGWKGDLTPLTNRVKEMEARIDLMEKELPDQHNFILPGGSDLGAFIHVVRSVCRRVERKVVSLNQITPVNVQILIYLNRLSDLLYMLARFVNKTSNVPEIIWNGKMKV
jgi:cob(I)alamin adenosyltransferase